MDAQLPSEFNLVIIGTGMIESIVSAAASRIGKTVLHIDRSEYYGGQWASFNLNPLENLCKEEFASGNFANDLFNIKDFTINWNLPEEAKSTDESGDIVTKLEESTLKDAETKPIEINESICSRRGLLAKSRKFNIDLAPKLQYARGDFVELLISSNIARYAEYRSVSRVLIWLNKKLEVVPCSRSDVFANSKVSVIEKRMLMKLLTSLDEDSEDLKSYEDKTYYAFLKDRKLTPDLIHYVLYAISQSTDSTPCLQGIRNTKRFLESLGRFGKTPFLFSMYGSGETTQAFCRLSAVFGGIFALNQSLERLTVTENKVTELVCNNQHIKTDHIVMSADRAPMEFVKDYTVTEYISRAVFITDRSVMDSEQEHLTLLMYPPENGKNATKIIEMGTLTGTCPKGLFLVHLISKQQVSPKEDFQHIIDSLFNNEYKPDSDKIDGKPQILWSCFFSIPNTNDINLNEHVPENVFLCSGPDLDLDYDLCIKKAKEIFNKIDSDLEFLPRAPDPEEIVFGDETENSEDNNIPLPSVQTEVQNEE